MKTRRYENQRYYFTPTKFPHNQTMVFPVVKAVVSNKWYFNWCQREFPESLGQRDQTLDIQSDSVPLIHVRCCNPANCMPHNRQRVTIEQSNAINHLICLALTTALSLRHQKRLSERVSCFKIRPWQGSACLSANEHPDYSRLGLVGQKTLSSTQHHSSKHQHQRLTLRIHIPLPR